jgi:hypothetical protein
LLEAQEVQAGTLLEVEAVEVLEPLELMVVAQKLMEQMVVLVYQ